MNLLITEIAMNRDEMLERIEALETALAKIIGFGGEVLGYENNDPNEEGEEEFYRR